MLVQSEHKLFQMLSEFVSANTRIARVVWQRIPTYYCYADLDRSELGRSSLTYLSSNFDISRHYYSSRIGVEGTCPMCFPVWLSHCFMSRRNVKRKNFQTRSDQRLSVHNVQNKLSCWGVTCSSNFVQFMLHFNRSWLSFVELLLTFFVLIDCRVFTTA